MLFRKHLNAIYQQNRQPVWISPWDHSWLCNLMFCFSFAFDLEAHNGNFIVLEYASPLTIIYQPTEILSSHSLVPSANNIAETVHDPYPFYRALFYICTSNLEMRVEPPTKTKSEEKRFQRWKWVTQEIFQLFVPNLFNLSNYITFQFIRRL